METKRNRIGTALLKTVIRSAAVLAVAVASLTTTASGAQITANWALSGQIAAHDRFASLPKSMDFSKSGSVALLITPGATNALVSSGTQKIGGEVISGLAKASLMFESEATAQIGRLRVKAEGDYFARTANFFAAATARTFPDPAQTSASWQDTLTFQLASLPSGTELTVSFNLDFQSEAIAAIAGGGTANQLDGYAATGVTWAPIGYALNKPEEGRLAGATDNLTHTLKSSSGGGETVLEFELTLPSGKPVPIGAVLAAGGVARAASGDERPILVTGEVSSFIGSNASRSLTWGGITRVTDALANEITDWTVTSESGFDYSRPFSDATHAIPEPSTLLLLATGLLGLLGYAWRREKRAA